MNPVRDHATCTEVVEQTNALVGNVPYQTEFNIDGIQGTETGSRFTRASILASQYKFYRATKVEYMYIPSYNTFQEGSGSTIPYIFTVMNRSGEQLPASGLSKAQIERMGATPVKFNKTVLKTYKPNILVGTASTHKLVQGTNPTGYPGGVINWSFTPKYDEWLSTEILGTTPAIANPGGPTITQAGFAPPTYYGHWSYLQQDRPTETLGTLVIKVHWEFKEPRSLQDATNLAEVKQAILAPSQQ